MNHIKLRRLALSAASVSFGSLAAIVMLWTSVYGSNAGTEAAMMNSQTARIETAEQSVSISCTPLEVRQLAAYDGNFIEDGSNREVMNVAAVMLYNNSDRLIPYAFVTVYTENCRYTFDAYMLPPRSAVLVPERSAQKLTETKITDTFGWTTVKNEKQGLVLEIQEQGMGSLRIKNLSGQKIKNMTVYHRAYIADGGFYMGGRAFMTKVPEIAPGEEITIYPSNYASGYSKVIYYE